MLYQNIVENYGLYSDFKQSHVFYITIINCWALVYDIKYGYNMF